METNEDLHERYLNALYQLNHERLRREGFERTNGVLQSDLTKMTGWGRGLEHDLRLAQEENARIKAELERLRHERIHDINQIGGLQEENADIEAKLAKSEEHNAALCERMQDLNSELHTCSCANANMNMHINENARLKAEVERLRKAGDAMAKAIRWLPQSISDHHLDAWNAAKEGKQS